MLHAMKSLPALLALVLLASTLHAQQAVPPEDKGDPFVKKGGEAAAAGAQAEDSWKQCVITFEAYAIDKNDAVALLEAEPTGAARYRKVVEMAKAGKARLEILESLTTKSGQSAVIESLDETRYGVEFSPPAAAKGIPMPSAWETRNVGDTLEVEPVIGPDGRTCDINMVPNHVSLVEFSEPPTQEGAVPVSQPIFETQKFTTSTTVIDGEPHYFGTMSPHSPQGIANGAVNSEIWLAFLNVTVQGAPPAKVAKPAPHPGPDEVGTVELQYSWYSLERTAARELLLSQPLVNGPWEKLKPLLADKKARLEHFSTIRTKSGQRAVVEEIREIRYGTEHSPEHRAGSTEHTQREVTNTIGGKKENVKEDAKNADSTSTSTETITTMRSDATSELIPSYATDFETRNAGVTVEVEPVVGPDGVTIDLNNAVQSVKFVGNLQVTGVATHYPPQPLFETAKVTTSITAPSGVPVLISTLNPPGADGVNGRADTGRTVLLFVRAVVAAH